MPASKPRLATSAFAAAILAMGSGTALAQVKAPDRPVLLPAINPNPPKQLNPGVRPKLQPQLNLINPNPLVPSLPGAIRVVTGFGLSGQWTGASVTRSVNGKPTTLETPARPLLDIKAVATGFSSEALDAVMEPLDGGYDALIERYQGMLVLTQGVKRLPEALGGKPDVFTVTHADGSVDHMLLSGDQMFFLNGVLAVPGTVSWSMATYLRTGLASVDVAVLPQPNPQPAPQPVVPQPGPVTPVTPVAPLNPAALDPDRPVNPAVGPEQTPILPNVPIPAPLQASACQELDIVTGLLNMKGGTEMVQLVRGFYVEFGVAFNSQPSQDQCAATLEAMRRAGLDPAAPDGGLFAAQAYLTINPQPFVPDAPDVVFPPAPAPGTGCAGYFDFLAELSTTGADGAVSLVVSLSGGTSSAFGGAFDDDLCSSTLSLFVEAGLDPQAPAGGFEQAVIWLEENPQRLVELAVEVDNDFEEDDVDRDDFEPDPRILRPAPAPAPSPKGVFNPDPFEPSDYVMGAQQDYAIFARPRAPGEMQDNPRDIYAVFHVTPANAGGDYAAPGQPEACNGPRRLSDTDHMRAWTSVREAMRWIGAPGEILSSRECASGELAIAGSYATAGDPSYTDGPDELVPAQLSVTFDDFENTQANRAYALERISLTLAKVMEGRDKWRMIFAPANAVSATLQRDVEVGSTYVMDTTNGNLVVTYRMSMPGD